MDEEGIIEETPEAVEKPEAPEAEGATDPTAPPPDIRPRPRWRRAVRWGSWGLVSMLFAGLLFFVQTGSGQSLVVDELLGRVRGSLAGELTVDEVGTPSLLLGLTLRGVRLAAEGGRHFLEADSVVLRYSPLSLALGSPRVRSSTFFGLDVEISRYPDDDLANINRLVASGPPGDTIASPSRPISLGRVAVRGGTLTILMPAEEETDLTVPAPTGGHLRRIALEDIDLDLERTVFRSGGAVMLDARLASLSASVYAQSEPLVIREAQGDLTFGDRGLRIEGAEFRLPGSFLEGALSFGSDRPDEPSVLGVDVRSEGWGDLSDLAWVDPRVPPGRFRGEVGIRLVDGVELELREVYVQTGASAVVFNGGTHFGDAMSLRSLLVTAQPLGLALLEPWLDRELPFEGMLRGSATLGGTLRDLDATGRITFTSDSLPEASTTADFSGTVHLGDDPGGTSLEVRLDPFDYRVLEPVWPDARLLGSGRVTAFVEGRANDGLLIVADATHRSDLATTSRIVGRGTLRRNAEMEWMIDARGELSPLSLPLLGRLWPQVDVPGAVRGPVRVDGRMTDLHISADLTSDEGRVVLEAFTDLTAPGEGYSVEADVQDLDIAAFTSSVPTPSQFSGRVTVDGAGFDLDSLRGSASVALSSARIGGLDVDSVHTALRFADGLLAADDLRGSVAGISVEGGGSIGLTEGRDGEAHFEFEAETLLGLRPVFMGDSILVGDTLNPLEQDALRARGIDPDTLPTALEVRMAGALEGTADLRGSFSDLDLNLLFDLVGGAYGPDSADSARVSLTASDLPETLGDWDVDVVAQGVVWSDREFDEVSFDGTMLQRQGEGTLDVVRNVTEGYFLTGAFALDSLGGEVELTDALLQIDDHSWELSGPATMAWDQTSLTVDSLEIRRVGEDPMLLVAAGTLTRGGASDFRLIVEGFHAEQAFRVAQREDIDVAGHIDLELDVSGPAESPVIDARFQVREPRYGAFELAQLEGFLQYQDLAADFRLDARDSERSVLTAEGVVPVNLALTEVEGRSVDETMDVSVSADSLDAALALVYLGALEDVIGTVSAEMLISGTTSSPAPRGTVTLADAAWTIGALGVRHTGVSGDLVLRPDRTVAIKLATTGSGPAAGMSTVSGLVQLEPVTNPTLDLDIAFDRFLAVDRRDMQGRISGDLSLTGTYELPVTEGTLRMEEGTLFVEEFVRSAGVVDLRSPLLYSPELAVDTTVFVTQSLLGGLSNPFLDNLRVDVEMAVPRNLWLRSSDMNVEMGGDLTVRYDRGQSDLVLVGELLAQRGSYAVFGRTFEVDGGTASFLGQPGVNPTLDIQAISRVRRREGDRLEVRASVQGTLVEPLVTLSTEEAGLSQSDLISFLVFGRSAAEVGTGSAGFGGDLTTGGLTLATGALVNQLGTAIAEEIPLANQLDYLSFSQSAAIGGQDASSIGAYSGNVFGGTQVELGKYLNEDVFVIFVFGGQESVVEGESGSSFTFRGVRMELAVSESTFLELFWEDRFLRSGSSLGASGLDGEEVVGIFMFGEWGFGSRQQQ
jgi:hypothetical protein